MIGKKLFDWLTMRDYWDSKNRSDRSVVARYSRGNVNAQLGRYMSQDDLDRLSAAGRNSSRRLRERAARRASA